MMIKRKIMILGLLGNYLRMAVVNAGDVRIFFQKEIPMDDVCIPDCEMNDFSGIAGEIELSIRESGFTIKKVYIIIDYPMILWRFAVFPKIGEKKLAAAIGNSIGDYFPAGDYVCGHSIIGCDSGQHQLLLAAAPTGLINGCIDLCRKLNLEILSIDGYVSCVGRYLSVRADAGSVLVCYKSLGMYTFIYLDGGILRGVRTLADDEYLSMELSKLFGYYFQTDNFRCIYIIHDSNEVITKFFILRSIDVVKIGEAEWEILTCCLNGTGLK